MHLNFNQLSFHRSSSKQKMRIYLVCIAIFLIKSCDAFWKWADEFKKKTDPSSGKQSRVAPVDIPVDLTFPDSMEIVEANNIVASGFISALYSSDDTPFMFKTILRNGRPFYPCDTIEFINLPSPNPSPFVGGPVFKLMKGLYNGKFAWQNGDEFLSFIPNNEHGTWIVGSEAGVDSGYVFIKPNTETLVPISAEMGSVKWHWLMHSAWQAYADARLVCRDEQTPVLETQSYYEIEYFDIENNSPQRSYFIPGQPPHLLPEGGQELAVSGMYLDKRQMKWIPLKNLNVLAAMGQPNLIRESNKSPVSIGHLINEEHGAVGWRLTFRYALGFDTAKTELSFLHDRLGPKNGYSIARLSSSQLEAYSTNMHNTLTTIAVGDFVWLWFSIDSQDADKDAVTDISPGRQAERHDELLLECISIAGDRAVFSYYGSDRVKTMRRSILSRDTDFVLMERSSADGTDKSVVRMMFSLGDVELKVHGVYNIGADVVSFIKTYLNEKEGALGGLPACFMYHAAVSLPRALVYAAEIVCVLMGSKPMAMIQYLTPSDHQWKFPLVQKLAMKILSTKLTHPDLIDVNATITTLGKDKTLILHRSNRKYLVDLLLPLGEAQALHPGPYLDHNNLRYSQQQQIYNAWWNGFILGYPTSFIDSYCMTFQSDLNREERMEQIANAKANAERYFRENNLDPVKIGAGLDPPVDKLIWSYL
jgi:hypothetical protein